MSAFWAPQNNSYSYFAGGISPHKLRVGNTVGHHEVQVWRATEGREEIEAAPREEKVKRKTHHFFLSPSHIEADSID